MSSHFWLTALFAFLALFSNLVGTNAQNVEDWCGGSVCIAAESSSEYVTKLCLTEHFICNGHVDCKNGTDEEGCEEKCDSIWCERGLPIGGKHCLKELMVCDGHPDCVNGEDEDPTMCSFRSKETCPTIWCTVQDSNNGMVEKCLTDEEICDGSIQCVQGLDEDPLMCENREWCKEINGLMCPTPWSSSNNEKWCVQDWELCDGHASCKDGSDEQECEEKCDSIWCESELPPGKGCLRDDQVCDGYPQCANGEDEDLTMCKERCKTIFCESSMMVGRNICLQPSFLCNRLAECVNGTDEDPTECKRACEGNGIWCMGPTDDEQCFPLHSKCDGFENCKNGEDEQGC